MNRIESAIDVRHADLRELEEVLERESLNEICRSVFDLFKISVRVFSSSGTLLSGVHEEQAVCAYVNGIPQGRIECETKLQEVTSDTPDVDSMIVHPCFTGAVYRIDSINYQGQQIGRVILGPYLPEEQTDIPASLSSVVPGIQKKRSLETLEQMPRLRSETAAHIVGHLTVMLELVLFSSHKTKLASEMHVLSVKESYRELSEKNEALAAANEEMKKIDRLKSNFLATVSHELRTPLTSIIGYADMLAAGLGGSLTDEQSEFVETIRNKGDQLLSLIGNLLDLGKLEQEDVNLNLKVVKVEPFLDDLKRTMTPIARAESLSLSVVCEEGIPSLRADPVRLRQVFVNLMDNAVKFSETNSEISLSASLEEAKGSESGFGAAIMAAPERSLRITVRDQGIGIPEHAQARVFDAFYQVDSGSTRAYGGTGLGLSIVKKLVRAHSARIEIESAVGEGTAVHVVFPETALI